MGFGRLFERFDRKPNATHARQKLWASFSQSKKSLLRKKMGDSDKDGVPDYFDCRPHNPNRQDDTERLAFGGGPMWPGQTMNQCRNCGRLAYRLSQRGWCDDCEHRHAPRLTDAEIDSALG
jgi:ribosomal protein L37E